MLNCKAHSASSFLHVNGKISLNRTTVFTSCCKIHYVFIKILQFLSILPCLVLWQVLKNRVCAIHSYEKMLQCFSVLPLLKSRVLQDQVRVKVENYLSVDPSIRSLSSSCYENNLMRSGPHSACKKMPVKRKEKTCYSLLNELCYKYSLHLLTEIPVVH